MQEVKERKYDCIVVGGGASGLAAISAMADLGVTNTILLEKSSEVGGCLLSDSERLSLSGKAFSGKELFSQFLRLIEIYEIKTATERELVSVKLEEETDCNKERRFAFRLIVRNLSSQREDIYHCKYLVLAFPLSRLFALNPTELSENRMKIIEGQSLSAALELGGKIGRELGELLLREKQKEKQSDENLG